MPEFKGQLVKRSEAPTSNGSIRYSLAFKPANGAEVTVSSFHESAAKLEYQKWYDVAYTLNGNYKNATSIEESTPGEPDGAAVSAPRYQQMHPSDLASSEAQTALRCATDLCAAGRIGVDDVAIYADTFFEFIQRHKGQRAATRAAAPAASQTRPTSAGEQNDTSGAKTPVRETEDDGWDDFWRFAASENLGRSQIDIILGKPFERFKATRGATPAIATQIVTKYLAEQSSHV